MTMQRHTHYRRRNHGTTVPRNFVFVDVYRRNSLPDADTGSYYVQGEFGVAESCRFQNGRVERWQRYTFYTPDQFWLWLTSKERPKSSLWIVGHGIGQTLTMLGVWDLVDKGVFRLQPRELGRKAVSPKEKAMKKTADGLLVDADPPTIILLYSGNCVLHIVDIRNYGQAELHELAAEIDQELPELPERTATHQQKETYLRAAVNVVRRYFVSLIKFWDEGDYGVWKHTVGGLALAAYRHKFMQCADLIHDCKDALKVEREALVGGQWVCHWVGKVKQFMAADPKQPPASFGKRKPWRWGPVHQLDVNGLYPSVMEQALFPVQFVAFKEKPAWEDVQVWRATLLLIARVRICSEYEPYPCMHEGERWWAVGDFWTVLCGPELLRAYDSGHVAELGWIGAYAPGRMFPAYVQHFHQMRLQAMAADQKLRERFAKLLLVSLAGKFGQRAPMWDFIDDKDPMQRWGTMAHINAQTGEIEERRYIAGYTQLKQGLEEGLESNPAIEAFVNCYGREQMRTYRQIVGPKNLLYQACDSLYVTDQGRENLTDYLETYPGELGKFRIVETFQTAEFRGPNDLTLDGTHVVAGISSHGKFLASGKAIDLREATLRYILTRKPDGLLKVEKRVVEIGHYHPRGIIESDGFVSPPQFIAGAMHFDRRFSGAVPLPPADNSKQ